MAEAARAEVDADPDPALLVLHQVDVVVARADRAELRLGQLRELALRREVRVADLVEHRVVDALLRRDTHAERDPPRDLAHDRARRRRARRGRRASAPSAPPCCRSRCRSRHPTARRSPRRRCRRRSAASSPGGGRRRARRTRRRPPPCTARAARGSARRPAPNVLIVLICSSFHRRRVVGRDTGRTRTAVRALQARASPLGHGVARASERIRTSARGVEARALPLSYGGRKGAGGGSRTPMSRSPPASEAGASARFATPAHLSGVASSRWPGQTAAPRRCPAVARRARAARRAVRDHAAESRRVGSTIVASASSRHPRREEVEHRDSSVVAASLAGAYPVLDDAARAYPSRSNHARDAIAAGCSPAVLEQPLAVRARSSAGAAIRQCRPQPDELPQSAGAFDVSSTYGRRRTHALVDAGF